MARILLYTGKGGVGKTSIAAASAVLSADRGYRTLVLSTDVAHSLGDAFDMPIGNEPTKLAENLWAQEPEIFHNIEKYWGTIQRYFSSLFSWRGLDEVMAEEMTVLPGMDELGSLLWIADHHDRGDYDVIIVDSAPTGETLRLLAFPEAARWWVERIAPIGRRMTRVGRPILERVVGVPMPGVEVFDAADDLLAKLDHVHRLLSDPRKSSVRVVLNLERVAINEAQRSFTYFHLYGYPADLVVCNRVLPANVGEYFKEWRAAQRRYLPMVEDSFAPVPVRSVPFFEHEMVGIERLRELGTALFHMGDPGEFLYRGKPYTVRRVDGGYEIALELPFTTRQEVSVARHRDELVLQVAGWRRTLVLPRALLNAPTQGAKMDDSTLRIRFGTPPTSTRVRGGGNGARTPARSAGGKSDG